MTTTVSRVTGEMMAILEEGAVHHRVYVPVTHITAIYPLTVLIRDVTETDTTIEIHITALPTDAEMTTTAQAAARDQETDIVMKVD